MKRNPEHTRKENRGRRRVLKQGVALGVALTGAPWVLRYAHAQGAAPDLGAYQKAKINWRLAEGQTVNVAVIPAAYFDNLIALTPEFEALTGVKVRYDKVPPGQIRQKAVLDLSSKTGNISTHAADPMYLPLYVANKWIELARRLSERPEAHRQGLVQATRTSSRPGARPTRSTASTYGIPYDGEVTIQTYRRDLYDAKGLKPADTFDEVVENAKALTRSGEPHVGLRLRGFAGAGQNMYIYPSIFGAFGGKWFDPAASIVVNSPEAVAALEWYVTTNNAYAPPAAQNWNWPDIADAFAQGTIAELHRRPHRGHGDRQPRANRRSSARSATRAGPRARPGGA